jgi:hypothetical protein
LLRAKPPDRFISPPLSTPSAHPVMASSNRRRRCSGPAPLAHRCQPTPASIGGWLAVARDGKKNHIKK